MIKTIYGLSLLLSVNSITQTNVLHYYSDWSYVPRYNNADDSEEYKTANGFSYHQGPVSEQPSYCMSK